MSKLNKKQKELAAVLLDEYSERLSNDSCNDWDFPDDWSHDEKVEMCRSIWIEQFGEPVEDFDESDLRVSNDCASSYLAELLRE